MNHRGDLNRVTVIGAGTMGHGIAQVAAQAGLCVTVYDSNPELAATSRGRIEKNLEGAVERGKLAREQVGAVLGRIHIEPVFETSLFEADAVIEAVVEDLAVKQAIFAKLETHCPAYTMFATNTSSLRIGDIAAVVRDRSRVLGMHFFNPVHVMKLLEIVTTSATSEACLESAKRLAERFGKDAIVVRDVPGFASSRLGIALGLEAMRMVEEGVASASDIDKAMTLGYGHPMGPLELTDLVGLDVRLSIAKYLHGELGERFRPPAVLETLVREGRLGKKTGAGFYDWQDGKRSTRTKTL